MCCVFYLLTDLFLFIVFSIADVQYEGYSCKIRETSQRGHFTTLQYCEYATNQQISKFEICGYLVNTPVVCCPLKSNLQELGQKSAAMCDLYFPPFSFRLYAIKGSKASPREFPHMAILGYDSDQGTQWQCGGSLISEWFVLTAAHCIHPLEYDEVKWVRLGDLDINETTDIAQLQQFGVDTTYVHDDYRVSSYYNDIALIKLNQQAKFNDHVKPICLSANRSMPKTILTATGWGQSKFTGERSSHLMKVHLHRINGSECTKRYLRSRKFRNGINDNIQICAGRSDGADTCPGDSGGPLQIKKGNRYYIVGITSFGKSCDLENSENSVGVYTRVAPYISWIEDIVWSD